MVRSRNAAAAARRSTYAEPAGQALCGPNGTGLVHRTVRRSLPL